MVWMAPLLTCFFVYRDVPTRSNGYKLFKKFCHLNIRKYSFSQRVVNDWNSSPTEVVQAPDVESFKLGDFTIYY